MKVGDLVKIYNFTHKARRSRSPRIRENQLSIIHARGTMAAGVQRPGGLVDDANVDAHFIGLIVKGGGIEYGHYRKVLRCCDGETELYNIARLEVISESR